MSRKVLHLSVKLLGTVSTLWILQLFTLHRILPSLYENESRCPCSGGDSFLLTNSLENWLRYRDGPVACSFEPRAVSHDQWYSKVATERAPNFTLTSAWLKTEAPSAHSAQRTIPPMYIDGFSMEGKVQMWEDQYFDQAYLGKEAQSPHWTALVVQQEIEKANKREMMKYSRDGLKIHDGVDKYISYFRGLHGIVIGSEDPWVEAILLSRGVSDLLTVEFGAIVSEHPQIRTITPNKFTESFLNGYIPQFDFGVTFSSLEHDGLGRYGDVLNPIGDLQSMAKLLSIIKPGGMFLIGIPSSFGTDAVIWNANRVYGLHRLPKLFAGWKLIDVIGKDGTPAPNSRGQGQHLWVLQNMNGCLNQEQMAT